MRLALTGILIIIGLTACGIKGSPLPPLEHDNNLLNAIKN